MLKLPSISENAEQSEHTYSQLVGWVYIGTNTLRSPLSVFKKPNVCPSITFRVVSLMKIHTYVNHSFG